MTTLVWPILPCNLRVVSTKTELLEQVEQLISERDELALEVNQM